MASLLSPRMQLAYGALACAALMGTALWFEHVMRLEPCPLCMVQRVLVIGLGAIMLLGALHGPGPGARRAYGVLIAVVAGAGAAVAGRHVWLQSLPADQVPACGPGLEYILDRYPLLEALDAVLSGSGECAEVSWTFLGLSIPGWTLVIFAALALYGLALALCPAALVPRARNRAASAEAASAGWPR